MNKTDHCNSQIIAKATKSLGKDNILGEAEINVVKVCPLHLFLISCFGLKGVQRRISLRVCQHTCRCGGKLRVIAARYCIA